MPVYVVTDPQTGRKVRLTGDQPPTDADLDEIFSSLPAVQQPTEQQPEQQDSTAMNVAKEFGSGLARGAAATADMAQMMTPAGQLNAARRFFGDESAPPAVSDIVDPLVPGGQMGEGLDARIVRGVGEIIPAALSGGGVMRGIGKGIEAGATGLGARVLRSMGATTPAQDVGYGAISAVGAEVGEDVAGTPGAIVGGMASPLLVQSVKDGSTELVKRAFRGGEEGRKVLADAIADFAEFGSTPTVGQGTGDGLRQGLENMSGKLLGGGAVKRSVDQTTEAMQKRLNEIADDISMVRGDIDAGRVIQRGIIGDDGFVKRFNDKAGKLWRATDSKIGADAKTKMTNSRQILGELVRDDQFAKLLNNPKLAQVKNAIDSTLGKTRINNVTMTRETVDSIPYKDLRALRTSIGEMLSSRELISDVPRAQLKRLYGALTQDTMELAESAGALESFKRANAYSRAGHNRIDDFVDRVAKNVDLEKVYASLSSGKSGIQQLNAIKRSLKPDEWEAVGANVIRNLGKSSPGRQDATGEAFSVNQFMTDWSKLGDNKKVLFSGSKKLNEYSKNLDTIVRAADRFKGSAQAMQNPSGTGQFVTNIGAISAGGASLATGNLPAFGVILGGVAANSGASKLMTNPKFVQWLADAQRTKAIPAHISALSGIAESEGLEVEVSELLDLLKSAGEQDSQQGNR